MRKISRAALWICALLLAPWGCEQEFHQPMPPPPPPAPMTPPPQTTVTAPAQAQMPAQNQAQQQQQPSTKSNKQARRFMEVRGHVTLNHRPVTSNVDIPDNAQIATGPDGFALITLMPGSAVQIRANSTLDVSSTPEKGVSVNLHIGGIWSILPHGANYEVVTAAATGSVRGTQFYVHVDKRKGTDICACDGDVHMQTADGKGFNQVITSPNHDHHDYHFAKKRKKVVVKHRPNPAHTMEGEEDLVHAAEASRE